MIEFVGELRTAFELTRLEIDLESIGPNRRTCEALKELTKVLTPDGRMAWHIGEREIEWKDDAAMAVNGPRLIEFGDRKKLAHFDSALHRWKTENGLSAEQLLEDYINEARYRGSSPEEVIPLDDIEPDQRAKVIDEARLLAWYRKRIYATLGSAYRQAVEEMRVIRVVSDGLSAHIIWPSTDQQVGPNFKVWCITGRYYSWLVESTEMRALQGPARRGLKEEDQPYVDDAIERLRNGTAKNPHDATVKAIEAVLKVTKGVAEPPGTGTPESRFTRINKRISKAWRERNLQ